MARWCFTVVVAFIFFSIQEIAYGSQDNCFGNSCYTFSDNESGQSWSQNRITCQGKGGDLVSIETEDEWQYINDEIQKLCIGLPNEWHIGLKKDDQGVWKWINGSPLTISKWQTTEGEPSGDGNVAVMSKDYPPTKKGLFNDLKATHHRAFICEIPKASLRK
ncbi:hypothetical protein ACROYT_G019063 [Oculina patagonica]